MMETWDGWRFVGRWLIDPEGNRYAPEDLRASYWLRQAWRARAGTESEIRFLAEYLRELRRDRDAGFIRVIVGRHEYRIPIDLDGEQSELVLHGPGSF